jgi:hypothetical protein
MIHELLPWRTLTRTGVPPLKVCRRPIQAGEVTVPVGATLDPEVFPHQIRAERLRQFYEMRRLEPVNPPPDTRQYYRERQAQSEVENAVIEPITPVAAHIVAGGLPTVEVPVEEETARPRGPRWRRPVPRK